MITVFTPTYNRKRYLLRLYENLKKQTSKDFEWLIVDDGSTDDTKNSLNDIRSNKDFKITYVFKKNGGKHSAHNEAIKLCKTDFLLIVDSDDLLSNDAIEILNKKCELIRNNDEVSGIIGNKGFIDKNQLIGDPMPNVTYTTGIELYQKMKFKGETLRLYKVSVLRMYPFPIVKGENFIPENVVFDKIDLKYKMLVIHEVLYLCEYQEDGLSNNIVKLRSKNPGGYFLSLKSTAETAVSLRTRIGVTILYIIWARYFKIKNSFKDFKRKITYIICLPASYVFQILKWPAPFNMFKEVKKYEK